MKKVSCKTVVFLLLNLCIFTSVYADEIKVVPIGKAVGVKIYTDGLLVVGTSEVNGENVSKKYGIKINDRIEKINNQLINSTEEFSKTVNENPSGVALSIKRDNQDILINVVPVLSEDNIYRLGLWVRDSTAGIGTVTYYNPQNNSFAALGHGINDIDTGNILSVKSGNILNCDILSVSKSSKGHPGEINGAFDGNTIGNISINSQIGIYGNMSCDEFSSDNAIPVAAKEQICESDAYILSDVIGQKTEKYSIKINKITNDSDKGLIIEITDPRLIDCTGGIVQGMSGSPIIQNGMLIGAVTHVFVNSPTKGYGTLAENCYLIIKCRKRTRFAVRRHTATLLSRFDFRAFRFRALWCFSRIRFLLCCEHCRTLRIYIWLQSRFFLWHLDSQIIG